MLLQQAFGLGVALAAQQRHFDFRRGDQFFVITAGPRAGQQGRDLVAHRAGEFGQRAEIGRQRRLDPRPDQPRQHRRIAFGGDGDGDRGAIDDRRGVEIALVGLVDDVQRHPLGPRSKLRSIAVRTVVGDENQCRINEIGGLERAGQHGDGEPGKVGYYGSGNNDDQSSRLRGQPGFVEGFFSTADDDDALTLDFVADGECVQVTHSRPFRSRIHTDFGTFGQVIEIQ